MKLDLDAYMADMAPPTLVIDRVEYPGTALLKFNDAVRLQQRLASDPSGATMLAVAGELCGLVGIPAEPVLSLPAAAVTRVVMGFFESANQQPESPK
ncbi:MAG TPA: hypothetical protein PKA66_07345 [Gemmatimonadales bacterium]|nr:hypothetical protein [Gemmatimonadales bacterium]